MIRQILSTNSFSKNLRLIFSVSLVLMFCLSITIGGFATPVLNKSIESLTDDVSIDEQILPHLTNDKNYTFISSITINNDAGMDDFVSNYPSVVSGNGSFINPFIINQVNTTSVTLSNLQYFVILNDSFVKGTGLGTGIVMYTNYVMVTVMNTIISDFAWGFNINQGIRESGYNITMNHIINVGRGLQIDGRSNIDSQKLYVTKNIFQEVSYALYLERFGHYFIQDNKILSVTYTAIQITSSSITINIQKNYMNGLQFRGILIQTNLASNRQITDNIIKNVLYGYAIDIRAGPSTNISANIITSYGGGIFLSTSNNNIADNNITNFGSTASIYLLLSSSINNTIVRNSMINGGINFGGFSTSSYTNYLQYQFVNNTLNSKSVFYSVNGTGLHFTNDANISQFIILNGTDIKIDGYSEKFVDSAIIIVDSTNIKLSNIQIDGFNAAIKISGSKNITIQEVKLSYGEFGINIQDSTGVNISSTTFTELYLGVYLYYTSNIIIYNFFSISVLYSIEIYSSDNITISNSYLFDSEYAIYVDDVKDIAIFDIIILNSWYVNLSIEDSSNIYITNSIFSNSIYSSVYIDYSDNVTLSGNLIQNSYYTVLEISYTTNLNIMNNQIISQHPYIPISITYTEFQANITISQNTIIGRDHSQKSLLFINGVSGINVTSNYYSNYNNSGIYEISNDIFDVMPLNSTSIEFSEINLIGDDLQYNLGQNGNEISFKSTHNTFYQLYRNGDLISTGILKANEVIKIEANNLPVGINTYSIVVPSFYGKGSYVKTITVNVINPVTVPTVTETITETSTITTMSDPTDDQLMPTETGFLGNQRFIITIIAIVLLQITRIKTKLLKN
jgi:hypothetical protein